MFKISVPAAFPPQEAQWTLELLGQLDWHRFQELVSRLLHRAGYLPETGWIRTDGSTALTLVNPTRPNRLEAVVQCAPWIVHDTTAAALQELYLGVQMEQAKRGIFVTPGIFKDDAREFAHAKSMELVDGTDLLHTLLRMPADERSWFLAMTTVGPYMIPSCPTCLRKLELVDDSAARGDKRHKQLTYKDKRVEGNAIDCRSLVFRKNADVSFLKNVTTGSMTVHGQATGNFVVNGRLHITSGGCVSGLVSARGIQLDPGGTLEAEARILKEAELHHLRQMPVTQLWRCPRFPKCRATLPVR